MYETLEHTALFKEIDSSDIELYLNNVDFKIKSYKKDDIIGLTGTQLKGIHILLNGSVRGEMLDYSGKTITIENIISPNLIAPAFLFGKKAALPVDVIVNKNTTILFLSKNNFITLMQNNSQILSNFLDIVSGRTQFLAEKINFLSFKTIREKYLYFIIGHHKKTGLKKFSLNQTQSQLSELFGVSRPALAKVIAELNNEGIIKSKGKNIELLNPSPS